MRTLACLTFAAALTLAASDLVAAADPRDKDSVVREMKGLADKLQVFFKKMRFNRFMVGAFQPPGRVQGSAGPEIQLKLTQALQARGYTLDSANYDVEIKGDYAGVRDEGFLGVRITARLYDGFGQPLADVEAFERTVFGEEAVPRLLAIATSTRPTPDYRERSDQLIEAFKNPRVHVDGSVIRTNKESPYGVEIQVKNGSYSARKPTAESVGKGRPFVPIPSAKVFAVRLINNSPHDAAVSLTLDGVNCFEFSTVKPKPTVWIVPPHQSIVVRGWHKTHDHSTEFKVVDNFAEGAAARLGLKPNRNIGLIQAAFSAAWTDQKPADEPAGPGKDSRAAGFGDDIQVKTRRVSRNIGHVRATIVIRYERNH